MQVAANVISDPIGCSTKEMFIEIVFILIGTFGLIYSKRMATFERKLHLSSGDPKYVPSEKVYLYGHRIASLIFLTIGVSFVWDCIG